MWALPDIKRLNETAVAEYEATKNIPEEKLLEGKTCEVCENSPATTVTEYYDVFSDTPKGKVYTCDDCYPEQSGDLFYCQACKRWHVTNYTWELYHAYNEFGEEVCLNCALDSALQDNNKFLTKKHIPYIDFEAIKGAKHLIPVRGEHWKEKLEFEGNVEFDSMDGHCISGGGIEEIKDLCLSAIEKSESKRCILILDAAYQFAVSIGVYYEK